MWYGHVDSIGMAMSLTAVRLYGSMRLMNEQENTLSYALTPNLGRPAKSVGVGRYSAQMKSTGTFGDAELQEALAGESFVLTGDGFLEDGVLSVTLKDAKGVSHDVTVEARKKTALVCTFAAAAKGKATIEVVLAGEEPDTYRFTASRKVTVR